MREEKSPDRNWKEYNEKLVQRGDTSLLLGAWRDGKRSLRR
jgi:hypothetical protein